MHNKINKAAIIKKYTGSNILPYNSEIHKAMDEFALRDSMQRCTNFLEWVNERYMLIDGGYVKRYISARQQPLSAKKLYETYVEIQMEVLNKQFS